MTRPVWLFDLDNTLHDANPRIFPHISRSMTGYLVRELGLSEEQAGELRARYWHRYGATLLGLMRHHGTDPHHFLRETHRFPDLGTMVLRQPALRNALRALPGRKLVFSNAPRSYADAVLDVMGVRALFEAVFSIERMRFRPKPARRTFLALLRSLGVAPARCVMVEDSSANLRMAKTLGMTTVWISPLTRAPAFVDLRLRSVVELPRHLDKLL
ncbi:MAG TPA: pyrimidine 5'-nucleotidase [Rhodocyclaceae bacterium]|nr:MAG: pyrimidine 5'-nucleotidase [Betaproteobacteria bacterium CG2_30_68_42]PIV71405.1 MAG: pyrimidine 5'-nucleotidase [Rhodocyclales bacterium CG17_big_fil_post_rev_8_21_14_2_50_68_7]PIX75354.1 MAG: pyrimidine 5'-nucleotidase [Rhodocyclales bacterium CG_4_10_14_3_um_filter_68_10]PJA56342.1 MAG: pyrimidine 5'-nucleotidase [Rhodocyclales bacterium CG_4_9_14_3_um_filter_68_10]HCX34610.1 pyrimidine 5'-nucleotidase [Rhodocyclaceae bacterium]